MGHARATGCFTAQDLRNRSFKHQKLEGADFSGSDLRGCDFAGAYLTNANFERAKMGQSWRQRVSWMTIAIVTFLIVGHGVSNLVFGSLGQTPTDKAWNYVMVLVGASGLAGIGGLGRWLKQPLKQWTEVLAGGATGAVTGFFYAGTFTGKNPQWAIAGAVLSGVCLGGLRIRWQGPTTEIMLQLAIALTTYGFTFLVGATALAMLNVGDRISGAGLGTLGLLYLYLTWQELITAVQTCRHAPGTSFRKAHLTNAKFSPEARRQADFSGAIGQHFAD